MPTETTKDDDLDTQGHINWLARIEDEEKQHKPWRDFVRKVNEKYANGDPADQAGDDTSPFNILYSNIEILKGVVNPTYPKVDVRRRYLQKDADAKQVATVLERTLNGSREFYPFEDVSDMAVQDFLLGGLGQTRIRYKPFFEREPLDIIEDDAGEKFAFRDGVRVTEFKEDDDGAFTEKLVHEELSRELIPWDQFGWQPARSWDKVTWCYILHFIKQEDAGQFGSRIALDFSHEVGGVKFAKVYEIFDKRERQLIMVSKGAQGGPRRGIIKEVEDPWKLENFYPFPKPLLGTLLSNKLIPIPDYKQYQHQAIELEDVTERLNNLTDMLRVVGVYDSAFTELVNIYKQNDGTLMPVSGFNKLLEKGGLQSVVDTVPLKEIAEVVAALEIRKGSLKNDIFELTGIGDIVRSSSKASETLGAQQLKVQGFNLRIEKRKTRVKTFFRELAEIEAEMVAELFDSRTLQAMTGIQLTDDQERLLRSDDRRHFSVNVETDDTVAQDIAEEQKNRIEFTDGFIQLAEKLIPAAQSGTVSPDLVKQIMHFTLAPFKKGRLLEDAIDGMQIQPQQQGPSKEEIEAQKEKAKLALQQQAQQFEQKLDVQQMQFDQQLKVRDQQFEQLLEKQKVQAELALDLKEMLGKLEIQRRAASQRSEVT